MKYLWLIAVLGGTFDANAQTVTGVRVSITADSAATAREQALEKAHDLAFQKLLKENFPGKSPPSHEAIMNMVADFSIDREKTTATSYTASLTFQFDSSQVQAWIQRQDQPPPSHITSSIPISPREGQTLKMEGQLRTFSEWQNIKKTFEGMPEVQKITILSLSPQKVLLEVTYNGSSKKLLEKLLLKGLPLSLFEKNRKITSNETSIR